jgi:hypothetical protein
MVGLFIAEVCVGNGDLAAKTSGALTRDTCKESDSCSLRGGGMN